MVPNHRPRRREGRRGAQRRPDEDLLPAVVPEVDPGPGDGRGGEGEGKAFEQEEEEGRERGGFRGERGEPAAEQEVREERKDHRLFFFFSILIFPFFRIAIVKKNRSLLLSLGRTARDRKPRTRGEKKKSFKKKKLTCVCDEGMPNLPHVPRSVHRLSGLGCLTTRFRRSERASLAHPARKTRDRARLRVA